MTPNKQEKNLCDGCQRGLPLKDGFHTEEVKLGNNTYHYYNMVCTADRYKQGTEKYGRGWYYDRFVERRRDYKAKTNQSIFSSEGIQYPDETYTNFDLYITNNMSQEEIIFISDGKLTSCDFCGISFSHKHKVGSLPKEFEVIEDKSKGTEKCEYCNNNHTKDMTCKPLVDSVISSQGDTPEWEEMKGQIAQAILGKLEYRGFYDAGKYLDDDIIEAIEPFIHKLQQEAFDKGREQERHGIEMIIKQVFQSAKDDHICRFNDGEQNCDCYLNGLSEVAHLINQRGLSRPKRISKS